jgi:hypothetical protein
MTPSFAFVYDHVRPIVSGRSVRDVCVHLEAVGRDWRVHGECGVARPHAIARVKVQPRLGLTVNGWHVFTAKTTQ